MLALHVRLEIAGALVQLAARGALQRRRYWPPALGGLVFLGIHRGRAKGRTETQTGGPRLRHNWNERTVFPCADWDAGFPAANLAKQRLADAKALASVFERCDNAPTLLGGSGRQRLRPRRDKGDLISHCRARALRQHGRVREPTLHAGRRQSGFAMRFFALANNEQHSKGAVLRNPRCVMRGRAAFFAFFHAHLRRTRARAGTHSHRAQAHPS